MNELRPHPDDDDLTAWALGDLPPGSSASVVAAHVAGCAECRSTADLTRRTDAALRELGVAREPAVHPAPPPALWERTRAALDEAPREPRPTTPPASGGVRRAGPLVAAALLGAAATWVGLTVVGASDDGVDGAAPTVPVPTATSGPTTAPVVATTVMHALDRQATTVGSAVVRGDDGRRRVTVTVDPRVTRTGGAGDYTEVWLLTTDETGFVSLGVVDAPTVTLTVPRDLDLDEYDVVDLSHERPDGDPAHSGDSVARGRLA